MTLYFILYKHDEVCKPNNKAELGRAALFTLT